MKRFDPSIMHGSNSGKGDFHRFVLILEYVYHVGIVDSVLLKFSNTN